MRPSINLFFVLLLSMLLGVFLFFKPIKTAPTPTKEVAQLELINFTLYSMKPEGVENVLAGSLGQRFEDRYEVTNVTFSDATKSQMEVMHADRGLYREDRIDLSGNVTYRQEGGIEFQSEQAHYDLNDSVVTTPGAFVVTMNESRVDGERLYFQTKERHMKAENINATYIEVIK